MRRAFLNKKEMVISYNSIEDGKLLPIERVAEPGTIFAIIFCEESNGFNIPEDFVLVPALDETKKVGDVIGL